MAQVTAPATGVQGLIVLTYDPTGLQWVQLDGWPLLGWNINETAPQNPIPITIGNPLVVPPSTGAILSPQWALGATDNAIYVPDVWGGTLAEFCTWIATNNGAARKVGAWFTLPIFLNVWNIWARNNPQLLR